MGCTSSKKIQEVKSNHIQITTFKEHLKLTIDENINNLEEIESFLGNELSIRDLSIFEINEFKINRDYLKLIINTQIKLLKLINEESE